MKRITITYDPKNDPWYWKQEALEERQKQELKMIKEWKTKKLSRREIEHKYHMDIYNVLIKHGENRLRNNAEQ